MSKQFSNVSSKYGAPMGRSESPLGHTRVRLFRVNLDSGGYDDGGAYWGHGKPIYCAQCGEGGRQFVRADSRLSAASDLGIRASDMARPPRAEYRRLRHLEQLGRLGAPGVALIRKLDDLGYSE